MSKGTTKEFFPMRRMAATRSGGLMLFATENVFLCDQKTCFLAVFSVV